MFEYDDKKVHEEFVKTVLVDKVSKYIKLDNIIKEKQDKLKTELKKINDFAFEFKNASNIFIVKLVFVLK